ncbi:MAG: aminopeptidase [Eubacterium sp.]|nr:aminopeptidase [Eubacterium sp.]
MNQLSEIEQERYELALERLKEIAEDGRKNGAEDHADADPAAAFFAHEAAFLVRMEALRAELAESLRTEAFPAEAAESVRTENFPAEPADSSRPEVSLAELQVLNRSLYEEVLPERYATCYGNPSYAKKLFGENGQVIGFVYMELRGAVVYAYENRRWDMLILMELLLSVYSSFASAREEGQQPDPAALRQEIYWYAFDYCQDFMQNRVRETLDPAQSFAADIILRGDLTDPAYLYRFGEYITENELRTARFLADLSEEQIDAIARTWTEGYRIGFEVAKKDLSIKKTVNIRWRLGFERVVRAAAGQFARMGLQSVFYRSASHIVNKHAHVRVGWYGAVPNPQFEYDHRNDSSLYLDDRFVSHRLQALQQAYEGEKELAAVHGGPAVMDVFGEIPFTPENNADAPVLSEKQQKLVARYQTEAGQITNRYIKGEERSFTIIAYPVPDIGDRFEEIFRETIRINTLDYQMYQQIQQKLIDALDTGVSVHITGRNGNETDLTVALHTLEDPEKQTNFENCVADVNIPVGEVFTSPRLKGTSGLLHVRRVYLEGFLYRDLKIRLTDGMVTDYSCANYENEAENRQLIEENILFHHKTVPIGEFAIGTNTTAYQIAQTYGIADKLPILIAEKMGPHFAMGDTCYSFQEDMPVFNPDGKEIIARDNECSLLRKTEPEKAYFGCHTDITIPYDELGRIDVQREDGSRTALLASGRFVLPGTEALNEPLDELVS